MLGLALAVSIAGAEPTPMPRRRAAPAEPAAVFVRRAETALAAGLPVAAIDLATACLEVRPEAYLCREVLGRAAQVGGQCERALVELALVRHVSGAWTTRSAVAEGVCWVKLGDLESALVAFDEAVRLGPQTTEPWLQRALVDARLRRADDLARDVVELEARGADLDSLGVAALWQAATAGPEVLDAQLALLDDWAPGPAERSTIVHAALLSCQRWLDLGDPVAAARDAVRAVGDARGHARLRACRGEALRRAGDPHGTVAMLWRPWDDVQDAPVLDTVMARALADLGDLEGAAARARDLGHDPDAARTAWYLARARGDAAGMEEARARLAHDVDDPDADLARLVPLSESAP